MSAKLSGENRLSKEYAVKCWMMMYVCRRDKASITMISLNNWFTVGPIFPVVPGRHHCWAVCFSWCALSLINPSLTTFWERIWVMSSKWEMTSGDLMQREMKKITYSNSAEQRGTFSSCKVRSAGSLGVLIEKLVAVLPANELGSLPLG